MEVLVLSRQLPLFPPEAVYITSSKNKAKGVFTTFDHSDPESEDKVSTSAHVVSGHSN